jgi:IS66 Orf2 like protein
MFRLHDELKVYVHRDAVDFRKSIHGLAAIVEQSMKLDPYARAVHVFSNQRRHMLDALIATITVAVTKSDERTAPAGTCLCLRRAERFTALDNKVRMIDGDGTVTRNMVCGAPDRLYSN